MYEILIHRRGPVPSLMARELNNINREAARLMGEYWHSRFFPKHFTHRGATEYGYAPRNQHYLARKLKKYGHTYPLVYTGDSRQRAGHPRIVATAKRGEAKVRVIMNAPTLNLIPQGGRINLRQELTTVSQPEAHELGGEVSFFYQYVFSKLNRTSTSRAA
jgi:hypothetical protein